MFACMNHRVQRGCALFFHTNSSRIFFKASSSARILAFCHPCCACIRICSLWFTTRSPHLPYVLTKLPIAFIFLFQPSLLFFVASFAIPLPLPRLLKFIFTTSARCHLHHHPKLLFKFHTLTVLTSYFFWKHANLAELPFRLANKGVYGRVIPPKPIINTFLTRCHYTTVPYRSQTHTGNSLMSPSSTASSAIVFLSSSSSITTLSVFGFIQTTPASFLARGNFTLPVRSTEAY